MSVSLESNRNEPEKQAGMVKRSWAASFRRIQMALAVWGILILVVGWLHNTYAGQWGFNAMLLIWLGLSVVGLGVTYGLAPEFLSAGMLFWWLLLLGLAFIGNLLTVYVFTPNGSLYNSSLWHFILAVGYFVVGYFMDRRWWWLSGWEVVVAVMMAWLLLDNTGRTATTALQINGFVLTKNLGLLFGLTAGLPLLIAALPVWKETYGKS